MSRDKVGMFFILIFPILMGLFFGSIMQGSGNTENARFEIAFCDEDGTEISKTFDAALRKRKNVDLKVVDRKQALDLVRRSQVGGAILLPKGFGETAGVFWLPAPKIEIATDPSRQAESGMLEGFVMQAIGEIVSDRFQDPSSMKGMIADARDSVSDAEDLPLSFRATLSVLFAALDPMFDEWQKQVEQSEAESEAEREADGKSTESGGFSMELANIQRIDISRKKSEVSRLVRSGWDISIPQATVWSILGVTSGFAIGLTREKEAGTLMRLQASPLRLYEILLGKAAGCYLSLFCVITLLCTLGYALGMRPNSVATLAIAIVCISYCFVGIMMTMSVIGKTEQSVSGAVWGINVIMAMFGGGMIPLAFMPGFMRTLSHVSPVKWAVLSLEGAIWRDFSPTEMLLPLGMLIAIGTAAGGLGSWMLARRSTGE